MSDSVPSLFTGPAAVCCVRIASGSAGCGAAFPAAGNRQVNTDPSPGLLSTNTAPFWLRTIPATDARPNPRPANFVEKNGSKMRCCTAFSMPAPVS